MSTLRQKCVNHSKIGTRAPAATGPSASVWAHRLVGYTSVTWASSTLTNCWFGIALLILAPPGLQRWLHCSSPCACSCLGTKFRSSSEGPPARSVADPSGRLGLVRTLVLSACSVAFLRQFVRLRADFSFAQMSLRMAVTDLHPMRFQFRAKPTFDCFALIGIPNMTLRSRES